MEDTAKDDARLGRVALRRELLAEGWTDRMLLKAVRRGDLVRVRHGAYVPDAVWRSLDDKGQHEMVARSVIARAGSAQVLSHASALALWGAPSWGLDLDVVHVTRRDRRAGRAEAGVAQHRGVLLPEDLAEVRGAPVTSPTRAALEAMTLLGVEQALVQVNDLMHRGLTTQEALRGRLARGLSGWPGSLTTDLVLRLADGRLESVAESRFLHLCWRAGLPAPIPQLAVHDEAGRLVAVLDFAWPEHRLFVEIDGKVKYLRPFRATESPAEVVMRERDRENAVRRLTQWSGLRFGWADLERPGATAAVLRRQLNGDRPRGGSAA